MILRSSSLSCMPAQLTSVYRMISPILYMLYLKGLMTTQKAERLLTVFIPINTTRAISLIPSAIDSPYVLARTGR